MQIRADKTSGHSHSIIEIIALLKKGLLLLALGEHLQIKPDQIVGISDEQDRSIIFFTKEGVAIALENPSFSLKIDSHNRSITIENIDRLLLLLSGEKIFNKFPLVQRMLDEKQYTDPRLLVEDDGLFNRCSNMQKMWKDWGSQGQAHLIASHQALQRIIGAKMKEPLSYHFDENDLIANGLSIEYQSEIYAGGLYGAKLLDIWHHYLVSETPQNHPPKQFLSWLQSLSTETLQQFEIKDLAEIPRVEYMTSAEQRRPWLLHFKPGNVVECEKLPKCGKNNEEFEIIYALGVSSKQLEFYGGPKKRGKINHSSFFGGQKVEGAGRIILKHERDANGHSQWIIKRMDNNSGHIKPSDKMTYMTLRQLSKLGVNLKKIEWNSKWGSVGQRHEAADLALKRLKFESSTEHYFPLMWFYSKRVSKISNLSYNREFKKLYHYLHLRLFKIQVDEVLSVAFVINDILHPNRADFIGENQTKQFGESLRAQVVELLKNICLQPSSLIGIAPSNMAQSENQRQHVRAKL